MNPDQTLMEVIAASAFYRNALTQVKELTKSSTADMLSIRRACSEALDAVNVGAPFLEILQQLNIENAAFRELLSNDNELAESVH